MEWSDGNISSVGLVRISRAARRDGNLIPMLSKLCDLGTDDFKNVFREFRTHILDKGGIFRRLTPIPRSKYTHGILPSTILKILAESPNQFRLRLGADEERLKAFWTDIFSTRDGMELKNLHPFLRNRTIESLKRTIPGRIHEDAGPFTKAKTVNMISWSSLMGSGTELEIKYLSLGRRLSFSGLN